MRFPLGVFSPMETKSKKHYSNHIEIAEEFRVPNIQMSADNKKKKGKTFFSKKAKGN